MVFPFGIGLVILCPGKIGIAQSFHLLQLLRGRHIGSCRHPLGDPQSQGEIGVELVFQFYDLVLVFCIELSQQYISLVNLVRFCYGNIQKIRLAGCHCRFKRIYHPSIRVEVFLGLIEYRVIKITEFYQNIFTIR